ncbi:MULTISPECIES: HD domain-containing protein [Nonlabens]|uniref:HD domain-containing protein n=1 Tax=Nonlabens TaxID=363408 RepID=UPI003265D5AC
MNSKLIKIVKEYCKNLIENSHCKNYSFHNWLHTRNVALACSQIAQQEEMDDTSRELLIIAAYFHDTGNAITIEGHEELSCTFAERFLKKHDYPEDKILIIKNLIKVTKLSQTPQNHLEQIMCDSDLSHLGSVNFMDLNSNLRAEWQHTMSLNFTDQEWLDLNLSFLENHHFYTQYAQSQFTPKLARNISKLKEKFA